jgi:hypothetical protein
MLLSARGSSLTDVSTSLFQESRQQSAAESEQGPASWITTSRYRGSGRQCCCGLQCKLLKKQGANYRFGRLSKRFEKRIQLTEHDRAVYEKSGYIRWRSVLHFYSIDFVKAGFYKEGEWALVPHT